VTETTATDRFVIDSSGWLEHITEDAKADLYFPYFGGDKILLVPTIVIYEVRKILLRKHSQTIADIFVSEALRQVVVPLDEQIALDAASVSLRHQLAMADAIVYTTALRQKATLIASDDHFQNLPEVVLL
jgi:predicted nucleic acid-binding protein